MFSCIFQMLLLFLHLECFNDMIKHTCSREVLGRLENLWLVGSSLHTSHPLVHSCMLRGDRGRMLQYYSNDIMQIIRLLALDQASHWVQAIPGQIQGENGLTNICPNVFPNPSGHECKFQCRSSPTFSPFLPCFDYAFGISLYISLLQQIIHQQNRSLQLSSCTLLLLGKKRSQLVHQKLISNIRIHPYTLKKNGYEYRSQTYSWEEVRPGFARRFTLFS